MKIIMSLLIWLFCMGMTYLIGDIALSSELSKYVQSADTTAVYIVGSLVIVAFYVCWYLLRKDNRLYDILVPVCVLLIWGLSRRKILFAGANGMLYSISKDLNRAYGMKSQLIDIEYVSIEAVLEFVLFVVAVAAFFAIYMIYRCNSLLIAMGAAFLMVTFGAVLDIRVSPVGIVLTVVSVIALRYVMARQGMHVSLMINILLPILCLCASMLVALFTYEWLYDRSVGARGAILEFADSVEAFVTGDLGKGYSKYYKIDDTEVNPSDEVVNEIYRDEKPDGNLYVTARSYVTYEGGTWKGRDSGYEPDNKVYTTYDESIFAVLHRDVADMAEGQNVFSNELSDSIVQYIRSHINYTISPGAYREAEDPVVYALYEGHEGYCIHFATAAAIAFRCVDIPSKYNVGYVVPSTAWKIQSDGTYKAEVLDKYSHAWTIVYDIGKDEWVIVDATPLADRSDILDIPPEPEITDADTQMPSTEETTTEIYTEQTTEQEEIQTEETTSSENITDSQNDTETPGGTATSGDNSDGNTDPGSHGGSGVVNRRFAGTIIIAVAIVLLCALAVSLRRRIIVSRRRIKMKDRNRIKAIYEISSAIYEMLRYAGFRDDTIVDDSCYAEEVSRQFKFITGNEFKQFISCVQAAIYGDVIPDDDQMRAAGRMYNKVRAYTYWSLSTRGRIVWKYVRCYDVASHKKNKHVRKE